MKKRHHYVPNEAILAHFPEISGNAVNGLGETERSRPRPFFWHPPEKQTHGELQQYIVSQFRPASGEDRSFRNPEVDRGPEPVAQSEQRTVQSEERWSDDIRRFALEDEADQVGHVTLGDTDNA